MKVTGPGTERGRMELSVHLTRRPRPGYERTPARGPLWVLAASALLFLLGTGLLLLPGMSHTDTDLETAAFTALAALTTAGIIVVDTHAHWTPLGQSLIYVLFQVGGFGFTMLATGLIWGRGRQLDLPESPEVRRFYGSIRRGEIRWLMRRVALLWLVVQVIVAIMLIAAFLADGEPLTRAVGWGVFHSGAAYANTGYELMDGGMVAYRDHLLVLMILAGAVIVGSLGPLPVFALLHWRRNQRLSLDTMLVLMTTVILLAIGFVFYLIVESDQPAGLSESSGVRRPLLAFFEAAMRTGGMSTIPVEARADGSLFFDSVTAFIGGTAGSVTGGVKVGAVAVVVLSIVASLRAEEQVTVRRREVERRAIHRALSIIVVMMTIALAGTIVVATLEAQPFFESMRQAVGSLALAGNSEELVGSEQAATRWVLAGLIVIGRFTPLLLVYLMTERAQASTYRVPEDSIRIG